MTQTTDAALVERLRKRASEDRAVAENSAATLSLLQPELDKFEAEQRFNTYVVRMAVDHKNSARKDGAYADDLAAAADTIEAQARRIEALEGRAVVNDFQRAAFDVFAAKLDGRVIQVGFLPADQCLSSDGEKVSGFTLFPEDGSEPEIWISDDTPVRGVPDVLFHELAHVLAGIEAGHDERWKAIEDSLWADLDRICTSSDPTP